MSTNIKYKKGEPFSDDEVDESISNFITDRATKNSFGKLVELLVERGILSRREVFNAFKTHEDYLG